MKYSKRGKDVQRIYDVSFPPSLSLRFLLLFRSVFTSEKQASRMRKSNAKVKLIRREWEKFLAQNYKSDTLFE